MIKEIFISNRRYMTKNGPESQYDSIQLKKNGIDASSCQENQHPDPAIGHEFVCTDISGKQSYINFPRIEKKSKKSSPLLLDRSKENGNRVSSENTFNIPYRADEQSPVLGKKNYNGDLLVDSQITNNRKIIIKSRDLVTDKPPMGSEEMKIDKNNNVPVIMTPNGSLWSPNQSRNLEYTEIMNLIILKLQEREKIGHNMPVDENLNILQKRVNNL